MTDATNKARWQRKGSIYTLCARAQDGGAVLATVVELGPRQCRWRIGGKTGEHVSLYATQRLVRKMLREGRG